MLEIEGGNVHTLCFVAGCGAGANVIDFVSSEKTNGLCRSNMV